MWSNRAFLERKEAWHFRQMCLAATPLGDGGWEADFLTGVLKSSWISKWFLIMALVERIKGSSTLRVLRVVRNYYFAVRIAFLGTKMYSWSAGLGATE